MHRGDGSFRISIGQSGQEPFLFRIYAGKAAPKDFDKDQLDQPYDHEFARRARRAGFRFVHRQQGSDPPDGRVGSRDSHSLRKQLLKEIVVRRGNDEFSGMKRRLSIVAGAEPKSLAL